MCRQMLLSTNLPQPVTRAGQSRTFALKSEQLELLLVLEITNTWGREEAHSDHIHANETVALSSSRGSTLERLVTSEFLGCLAFSGGRLVLSVLPLKVFDPPVLSNHTARESPGCWGGSSAGPPTPSSTSGQTVSLSQQTHPSVSVTVAI